MKGPGVVRSTLLTVGVLATPAAALAAPIDLNTWTAESYATVSGFSPGNWTVQGGGGEVFQSVNGQPTVFYSDFAAFGTMVTGTISVAGGTGDNDFIGFVIGFQPGDSSNAAADYLLVDWKAGTQTFNFTGGAADDTPGSTAPAGLAVSRVTGVPTADEFWGHFDHVPQPSGGVEELQRGATLGATGWVANTDYEFSFDFGPNDLVVYVDGVEELNIQGSFQNGRLGFYNFSQQNVTYSAFDIEPGSFPAPEPATTALLGLGLVGLALSRRRRARIAA